MYEKIVLVCGMPRSGTSWLGQIFASANDVAFRMEPLFSYRFKNIIGPDSSRLDLDNFFREVYFTDDSFITQVESKKSGNYDARFQDATDARFLVIKTTRHHHLLEHYLSLLDDFHVVSIVRHPCASISSWINTDREFLNKGCSVEVDWRSGGCRKGSEGEYWGFDDWLAVTELYDSLDKKFEHFNVIKYSDLLNSAEASVRSIFACLGISFGHKTKAFLHECGQRHDPDPYSVYKSKSVEHAWKQKLDSELSSEIIANTIERGLGHYL